MQAKKNEKNCNEIEEDLLRSCIVLCVNWHSLFFSLGKNVREMCYYVYAE